MSFVGEKCSCCVTPTDRSITDRSKESTAREIDSDCYCTVSNWDQPYCGCELHSSTISLPSPSVEPVGFMRERTKTIITFLVFLSSLLVNHLVLAIISDIISRDPLPDLAHSLIPQNNAARGLADLFAGMGCMSMFVVVCLFHQHRWIVGRRLFYIGTVLYIMRAISICVTHIPSGYQDNNAICAPPSTSENTPLSELLDNLVEIFGMMGLQEGDRLFCGDMLFSGHTTAVSLGCFFLNYYLPHSLWPVKLVIISFCGIAMVCVVIARAHYSVDVIMGYFISSIIFSVYHAFCEVPHYMRPRTRAFRRLFLFWTMYEVERKVPAGRLPNKLEWPLPWPKCIIRSFNEWNEQSPDTVSGTISKWLSEHRIKFHM